jgi:hypothetical protein
MNESTAAISVLCAKPAKKKHSYKKVALICTIT